MHTNLGKITRIRLVITLCLGWPRIKGVAYGKKVTMVLKASYFHSGPAEPGGGRGAADPPQKKIWQNELWNLFHQITLYYCVPPSDFSTFRRPCSECSRGNLMCSLSENTKYAYCKYKNFGRKSFKYFFLSSKMQNLVVSNYSNCTQKTRFCF